MLHGKALCESPGAPAFPQQTYQGTSSEWRFPWAKREVHTHQTSRGQGCWASSEPRGCRGQGREPGRGEGDTNSKMNGLNFLCFMEANKRRQKGGEKGDLSACTRSHAHAGQPRPQSPLVAGVARAPCTHLAGTALGQLLVWPSVPREHLAKRDRLLPSAYSSPCH